MGILSDIISGSVFDQTELSEKLVSDYYETNELKKQAEKQLKEWKVVIINALEKLGTNAKNIGKFQVLKQIKDTSKLDEKLLLELLLLKSKEDETFKKGIKQTVDEEGVKQLISDGFLSMDEVKQECYIHEQQIALVIKNTSKSKGGDESG